MIVAITFFCGWILGAAFQYVYLSRANKAEPERMDPEPVHEHECGYRDPTYVPTPEAPKPDAPHNFRIINGVEMVDWGGATWHRLEGVDFFLLDGTIAETRTWGALNEHVKARKNVRRIVERLSIK